MGKGIVFDRSRVRDAMKAKDLRPSQVARALGVAPSTVQRLLDDTRRMPSAEVLIGLRDLLGVEANDFTVEKAAHASDAA